MLTRENMLLGRAQFNQLPQDVQDNIDATIFLVNQLMKDIPPVVPFKVNDGYRRPTDTPRHGSITSWHLKGGAVDIDDDASQSYWIAIVMYARSAGVSVSQLLSQYKYNLNDTEYSLYMENPRWTPGWLHFQVYPPRSGNRIFIPSVVKPLTSVILE